MELVWCSPALPCQAQGSHLCEEFLVRAAEMCQLFMLMKLGGGVVGDKTGGSDEDMMSLMVCGDGEWWAVREASIFTLLISFRDAFCILAAPSRNLLGVYDSLPARLELIHHL